MEPCSEVCSSVCTRHACLPAIDGLPWAKSDVHVLCHYCCCACIHTGTCLHEWRVYTVTLITSTGKIKPTNSGFELTMHNTTVYSAGMSPQRSRVGDYIRAASPIVSRQSTQVCRASSCLLPCSYACGPASLHPMYCLTHIPCHHLSMKLAVRLVCY